VAFEAHEALRGWDADCPTGLPPTKLRNLLCLVISQLLGSPLLDALAMYPFLLVENPFVASSKQPGWIHLPHLDDYKEVTSSLSTSGAVLLQVSQSWDDVPTIQDWDISRKGVEHNYALLCPLLVRLAR
jgi:hypothetical protein